MEAVGRVWRWWYGRATALVFFGLLPWTGCAPPPDAGAPVAEERSAVPEPPRVGTIAPRVAAATANPAPDTQLAAASNVALDARVLLISASGSGSVLDAIRQILGYLGTPYDVLDASGTPLTEALLADGDHGKYQAIFLDLDDLSASGTSAFSNDEWMTLASYEAKFGVRRVALYGTGIAAYGLAHAGSAVDTDTAPITTHCTDAGRAVFVGANCDAPVVIGDGHAYPASPVDDQTTPLLVDDAGHAYAAVHTTPDGREALALTFAQAPWAIHTLALGYGLVNWATRGLFLGERHVFLSAQLDDLFLASQIYPRAGETYRINDADLQALANWQASRRAADPRLADLRLAFAANGFGARGGTQDPLVARAVALGSTFAWINHTWDHVYMDTMSYAAALDEFTHNDQALRALGLAPYSTENAVTPGVTGLTNRDAMQAAYDAGIRYLVSDSSHPDQKNPSPNTGIWNALVPGLLELPRTPTEIGYDNATPADLVAEYNARNVKAYSYDQIIASESLAITRYLLNGNTNPLMFHQANARDIGGGRSLVGDVIGAALDRYLAVATFPVGCPPMDELGERVADRTAYAASGATATIEGGARLTLRVTNAARVPVTGLCTPDAESYGGQTISYVDVPAGASVSFNLDDCGAGTGPTGPGAVGATGKGAATTGAMGPGDGTHPGSHGGCTVAAGASPNGPAMATAVILAAIAFARTQRPHGRRR